MEATTNMSAALSDSMAVATASGLLPLVATPWLRAFAARHLSCAICGAVAADPVMLQPSQRLACRGCARGAVLSLLDEEVLEASPLFANMAAELVGALAALPQSKAGGSALTQHQQQQQQQQRTPKAAVAAAAPSPVSPPRANGAGQGDTAGDKLLDADPAVTGGGFQGLSLNPNVPDAKAATKSATTPVRAPSASKGSPRGGGGGVPTPTKVADALLALQTSQKEARTAITVEETMFLTEIRKKLLKETRDVRGRQPDSSKQLKIKADDCYEKGHYEQAVSFYTQSINKRDETSKLNVLYGNRSAAYFMAMRFNECIGDCLAVIELEPFNAKICNRAVKAAVTMGDLQRALDLFSAVAPEFFSEDMKHERDRIRQGIETLRRAEAGRGSREADESWQLLIADFSETVPFRMRYAEVLAATGRFEKAAEVMAVALGIQRTAEVAYAQASYLYCSGFEHFDQAQVVLKAFADDAKCRALLDVVARTEEAKSSGNSAFAKREFAKAADDYTRGIAAAHANSRVLRILYCNRAAVHKELGRYREGIEDCNKAIDFDPAFSKAFARRARCLQMQHDYAAAVRDFKEAMRLDPADAEVQRELRTAEAALAKESERQKDFYYVMGVGKTATDKEIKNRYRELSLRWHPDKCVGMADDERQTAEHKFKVISEAYQTLIDPLKRREYDIKMERDRVPPMQRTSTFSYSTGFRSGAFADVGRPVPRPSGSFW